MVNQPDLNPLLRERACLQAALSSLRGLRQPSKPASSTLPDLPPPQEPMIRQPGLAEVDWDAADAAALPTASPPPTQPTADPVTHSFSEIDWEGPAPASCPSPVAQPPAPKPPASRAEPETTHDVLDQFDWE